MENSGYYRNGKKREIFHLSNRREKGMSFHLLCLQKINIFFVSTVGHLFIK